MSEQTSVVSTNNIKQKELGILRSVWTNLIIQMCAVTAATLLLDC